MQFLMLVVSNSEIVRSRVPTGTIPIEEWSSKNDLGGIRITGDRLRPSTDATSVHRDGDDVVTSTGFLIGNAVSIAGFDILSCDSHADAVKIAAEHPMAASGQLVLLPYWPLATDEAATSSDPVA